MMLSLYLCVSFLYGSLPSLLFGIFNVFINNMSKAYYFAQISRGVRIKIVPDPCVNSFVLKPTFHEENYICAHLWHLLYKKIV